MDQAVAHTLFIVEDDEAVRSALQLLAGALGWRVRAFPCGSDCLDAVREGIYPDCVLVDLNMPGMSGRDVLQALSDLRVDAPMVAMTTDDDSQLACRALQAGARSVLEKPFRETELQAALGAPGCR